MTLTFLWTDILIWLLVVAAILWGTTLGRSPQIRAQWRDIFQSKIALASAVVLSVYFALALLDSVHFKQPIASADGKVHYSTELESGLDRLFSHLKSRQERTYSAPFATHEYSKSIVTDAEGNVQQLYLPLKHVNPNTSIALTGVAVFGGLALLLVGTYQWHRRKMDNAIPWKTAYLTLWLTLGLLIWAYTLSFSYHVFGTDKIGQDVFLQTLKSIRTGVLIGVLTTLVMLPFALLLGISAGYFKGWVDDAIQYLYTTLNSIPGVLLIAAAVLMMQVFMNNHPGWFETVQERADLRLLFLILILGITSWTGLCRMVRAETLKISQVEYVQAARAFGVSHFKILLSHILPNLMHIVIISIVLDFSGLVLAEAVLSYVGVGVDPTMNSWGNMINQARLEMARDPMVWWSLLSAFIFMFCLVLAANLFSDRVQTVLDPRNRKA
jgi:peptide/nickel transport system permease protein